MASCILIFRGKKPLSDCNITQNTAQSFASLAKWLSVRLRTNWLWVRVPLQSLILDIQATVECGFTLKLVRDMIKAHYQMHRPDKYSQHSSIICQFG